MGIKEFHRETVEMVRRNLDDFGTRNIRVRLPLGAGIDAVAAAFVIGKARAGARCLELFPNNTVLNQAARQLESNPEIEIGRNIDSDAPIVLCTYVQAAHAVRKGLTNKLSGFAAIVLHEGFPEQRPAAALVRDAMPTASAIEFTTMPYPYPGMIQTDVEIDREGALAAMDSKTLAESTLKP